MSIISDKRNKKLEEIEQKLELIKKEITRLEEKIAKYQAQFDATDTTKMSTIAEYNSYEALFDYISLLTNCYLKDAQKALVRFDKKRQKLIEKGASSEEHTV